MNKHKNYIPSHTDQVQYKGEIKVSSRRHHPIAETVLKHVLRVVFLKSIPITSRRRKGSIHEGLNKKFIATTGPMTHGSYNLKSSRLPASVSRKRTK